jgi:hypothetical protein
MRRVIRISHRAPMGIGRSHAIGEFMEIKLAEQDGTCIAQSRPNRRIVFRNELGKYFRSAGRANSLGVTEILQADGYSMEGTAISTAGYFSLSDAGLLKSQVAGNANICVQI